MLWPDVRERKRKRRRRKKRIKRVGKDQITHTGFHHRTSSTYPKFNLCDVRRYIIFLNNNVSLGSTLSSKHDGKKCVSYNEVFDGLGSESHLSPRNFLPTETKRSTYSFEVKTLSTADFFFVLSCQNVKNYVIKRHSYYSTYGLRWKAIFS